MRKCSHNINDVLPVIDNNREYDPNGVIDCENIRRELDIPDREKAADFLVHYTTCKHIVIEEGGKSKEVEEAVKQIKNTLERCKRKGLSVDFIAFVYDGMDRSDTSNYKCKDNILYVHITGRVKKVEINGMPLRCYTKSQIHAIRRTRNLPFQDDH